MRSAGELPGAAEVSPEEAIPAMPRYAARDHTFGARLLALRTGAGLSQQEVEAQDARLAGVHLAEAVLAEAFDYPSAVALSAEGMFLAAGTLTGEAHLWRMADRRPLLAVHGHSGGVFGVALSGDGRLLASGSEDGTLKLWAAGSGACLRTLRAIAAMSA
jgi:hypothetical protein